MFAQRFITFSKTSKVVNSTAKMHPITLLKMESVNCIENWKQENIRA